MRSSEVFTYTCSPNNLLSVSDGESSFLSCKKDSESFWTELSGEDVESLYASYIQFPSTGF